MPSAGPPKAQATTAPPSPPARAAVVPGTTITTGRSAYGTILFDAGRQAIYLFDKEKTASADCYGACAVAWPPVLTKGAPKAAGAVRTALLGTTTRRDGSRQVTYAGHPLYYYAHEGKGQVTCHDVREYGGLWLVVTPQGKPAD
jgi:predicted lipoprotein with Yx(FWY)xxD motif